MLFGGGLITAALCSGGGSTYTNEQKTITSNGEYKPDDDVRWDKVTVDVPAAQNYEEIFSKIPTYYAWAFCNGKWVFFLKITDGFDTDLSGTSSFSYSTYESGGVICSVRSAEEKYHRGYICLYKNGSEFLCAKEIGTSCGRDSYQYGMTDSGIAPYKVSELITKCSGLENGTYNIYNWGILGIPNLKGIIHFSQRSIFRNNSTGEITSDKTDDIKESLDMRFYANESVFSNFSADERYNVFIELGKDLKSLIS